MENYNYEVLASDCIEVADKVINLHELSQPRLLKMEERYNKKHDDTGNDYYYSALAAITRVLEHRVKYPDAMTILKPKDRMEVAKAAASGTEVQCPQCKSKFVKTTISHVFCSNSKSKSGGNCKDRYWNIHDPDRKARLDNLHEQIGHAG
jgi:hypothetical protein